MMKDGLHILHVTKRYPKAAGGDASVVLGLEGAQRRNGHRVTVVTSNCSAIDDGPWIHKFGLPISEEALDRIGLRRVLSCLWGVVWGLRLLWSERPDVVHAHAPDLGASLSLPARMLGIPHVLTLHGTCIGNPMFGLKSGLERVLVRVGHYDRLFTVDPQALSVLEGLTHTRPLFIPNGVASEEFHKWQPPAHGARLLFVGRLEAVKNVDVLLTAVAEVRARGCEAALDIVGTGRLYAELQNRAAELGLQEYVQFIGQLSRTEVAKRLAAAAALLLPSSYEGFPMVLLEAWATGVPVIATSVAAIPKVCTNGEDALLVPPQDSSALAEAIMMLLKNSDLAGRLASTGHRKVQQYSHVAVNAQLEQHYRTMLSQGRRRPSREGSSS
jgi:glycosyltransferase involved in cell wall biosynthesis